MAEMQRAVVKSLPDDPNLTITLIVGGRQRNLDRPKAESLEKPLSRLQKAAAPQPEKRRKKSQEPSTVGNAAPAPAPPPFIGLHAGPSLDHPLIDSTSTTNEEAWQHGRLLRVGDTTYVVDLNPPFAERLLTHGTPFTGIPVVPSVQLHFADAAGCRWQWWRRPRGSDDWHAIPGATHRGYTPMDADEGCMLRVECTPGRRGGAPNGDTAGVLGEPIRTECGPVMCAPHPGPSSGRDHLTPGHVAPPAVRVVTYNILADQYAATDSAKNVLFASCPAECLEPAYRRPLILGELLRYHPDVACLQEVDDKMFALCLEPAMVEAGFDGAYTNKAGQVREGAAAFWRRDRFELIAQRDVTLKRLFPATADAAAVAAAKCGPVFAPMLHTSPALCTALQRVATIAQVLVLAPRGGHPAQRPLCLVNTHLFFHYAAPHIRTMHIWAILEEAAAAVAEAVADPVLAQKCGGKRPVVVFCGDLNSDLNDGIPGAIELLAQGRVGSDYWDWAFGVDFKWERDEEENGNDAAGVKEGGEVEKMMHTEVDSLRPGSPRSPAEVVPGVDLVSPLALAPVDGLRSSVTNYVKGYQGLLDYIWYEPGAMVVQQVVPVPPVEELEGYLPSRRFPSDHLAVVADLCFRSEEDSGADHAPSSATAAPGVPSVEEVCGGVVLPAALCYVGAAAAALRRGAMLAVPTDTLYGLAVCATDGEAVRRVYEVKGRQQHKPLAMCVADVDDVARYVHTEHLPPGLLQDLLPGRVTLLLKRRADAPLSPDLNPGVAALGIRIPDCQFLRAVCRQHRGGLALTSANLSGERSPVSVSEVEPLRGMCDAVFDGGALGEERVGSTVVDLSVLGTFRVVRPGAAMAETVAVLAGKHGMMQEEGSG